MAKKTNGHKATAATPTSKAAGMTKAAAIQQAVVALGKDAKPLQLKAYIKDHLALDISTNHISAAKTDIIRKMTGAAKPAPVKATAKTTPAPKPAAKKPVAKKPTAPKPQPMPVTVGAASNGKASGSVALADVQAVKALLGRVGPTNLKSLIDLLAN
jgi:hypothetical protein